MHIREKTTHCVPTLCKLSNPGAWETARSTSERKIFEKVCYKKHYRAHYPISCLDEDSSKNTHSLSSEYKLPSQQEFPL